MAGCAPFGMFFIVLLKAPLRLARRQTVAGGAVYTSRDRTRFAQLALGPPAHLVAQSLLRRRVRASERVEPTPAEREIAAFKPREGGLRNLSELFEISEAEAPKKSPSAEG